MRWWWVCWGIGWGSRRLLGPLVWGWWGECSASRWMVEVLVRSGRGVRRRAGDGHDGGDVGRVLEDMRSCRCCGRPGTRAEALTCGVPGGEAEVVGAVERAGEREARRAVRYVAEDG